MPSATWMPEMDCLCMEEPAAVLPAMVSSQKAHPMRLSSDALELARKTHGPDSTRSHRQLVSFLNAQEKFQEVLGWHQRSLNQERQYSQQHIY